ncbi:30S ribosomal protein S6 [Spirochaetia bacterium]|nr:30S ribosomal protein S6 [Spirochaetia bacterium]GHU32196.1 30S ribosomal protein S6 [Spirochaetia bacterium]
MRWYELTLIFPLEEDLQKIGREQVLSDLSKCGAEVEKTDEVGDRDLAYEIKRKRRGKYVLLSIKVEPDQITTLDRLFKLNANLLRYFFIVTPAPAGSGS